MLDAHDFDHPEIAKDEILAFIDTNKDKLRELSLRMVLKIADLKKSFPSSWMSMAKTTCMRRG
jgi:hypothetical protein